MSENVKQPLAQPLAQIQRLRETGYVVIPDFVPAGKLADLNDTGRALLAARIEPLEFEADLHYPGAPASRGSVGGETVRRLLDVYDRHPAIAELASAPRVRDWMETYFAESVQLSRVHHNCLMTKHPRFGSLTGWHRDIRYWSFAREDLVSVWIALGAEHVRNGALWFVPGSQRMVFDAERFDAAKFFRGDRVDNDDIIRHAQSPPLAPGDAVFFHCNTLHSAGQNLTDAVKFSLVFTYHGTSNIAVPGTRSASQGEVALRRSAAAAKY